MFFFLLVFDFVLDLGLFGSLTCSFENGFRQLCNISIFVFPLIIGLVSNFSVLLSLAIFLLGALCPAENCFNVFEILFFPMIINFRKTCFSYNHFDVFLFGRITDDTKARFVCVKVAYGAAIVAYRCYYQIHISCFSFYDHKSCFQIVLFLFLFL